MQLTHKAILGKAGLALALLTVGSLTAIQPASAQISGFGNGSGFTLNTDGNGTPTISGGTFQATTSAYSEATSAFYDTKQSIAAFNADFTYQDVTGGGADGFTFVLQNAGLTALGVGGGGLGYDEMTPSAALAFNIYDGINGGSSVSFVAGGANPGYSDYMATGAVNLDASTPVNVHVNYDGATLTEDLSQGSNSFSKSYAVDLPSVLGSSTAYVGFTGGDGGFASTQNISSFKFTPAPVPEAPTTVSFGLLLCLGLGGMVWSARRKKAQAAE